MNNLNPEENCRFCEVMQNRINDISFIIGLKASYVFLNYNQSHIGRSLLVLKKHYICMEKVPSKLRENFWQDLMTLHSSLLVTFNPVKINLALLGNKYPHLHWHLIPRYKEEDNINAPPWPNSKLRLEHNKFVEIRNKILSNLE